MSAYSCLVHGNGVCRSCMHEVHIDRFMKLAVYIMEDRLPIPTSMPHTYMHTYMYMHVKPIVTRNDYDSCTIHALLVLLDCFILLL
jgi:hypothetical protein